MNFVIIYGQIILTNEGITLHGDTCHLGGLPLPTLEEAEDRARFLVRTSPISRSDFGPKQQCTIIPRVYPFPDGTDLFGLMCQHQEWLEKIIKDMNDVNKINLDRLWHWQHTPNHIPKITHNGKTKSLRQWSNDPSLRAIGITRRIFNMRLDEGWDPVVAMTTPYCEKKRTYEIA